MKRLLTPIRQHANTTGPPLHKPINLKYRYVDAAHVRDDDRMYFCHTKVFSSLHELQCETKSNRIKEKRCNKDMNLGSDFQMSHSFRALTIKYEVISKIKEIWIKITVLLYVYVKMVEKSFYSNQACDSTE